jgi:glycerophosphoryl diester phosphodiesterase
MLIYAHRGASADFPEMSRAAYLAAVDQGADGFECDLRLTRDRVLVCWHDDDLSRMAGSSLVVADSTLAQLRAVTEIVTFEELLEIALTHKKNLALETKHPVPTRGEVERELLKALAAMSGRIKSSGIDISIMSFSWWAIYSIRKSGFTSVYLIRSHLQRLIAQAKVIGPGIKLLRANVGLGKKFKASGRGLYIWTVNTPEDLAIAYAAGADVVMSDCPGKMKAALLRLQ